MCSRGAVECIRALGGGEPGETLSTEVAQRLMAACDTLRECASGFTKLNYREHAAEAHVECAHCLRSVSQSGVTPDLSVCVITNVIFFETYHVLYVNTIFNLLGCMWMDFND